MTGQIGSLGKKLRAHPRNVSPPLSPESCVQPPSHLATGA